MVLRAVTGGGVHKMEPTGWVDLDYDASNWTTPVNQTKGNGQAIKVHDLFNEAIPIWSKLPPNKIGWCRCRGNIGK